MNHETPHATTCVGVILTTWPFIASLVLLLTNDWWLKQAFPGLITGKLSDFAGIAVVAMLSLAIAPRRRVAIFSFITLAFAWWKSPWSQPLIDAANVYLPYTIGRVVDYSDLTALLVLPLCTIAVSNARPIRIPAIWLRRLLITPLAAATMIGIMATSMIPTLHEYKVSQRNPDAQLNHTVIAAVVAEVAQDQKLECQDCYDTHTTARYSGKGLILTYSFPDGRTVVIQTRAYADGLFFGKTGPEKVDRLIKALNKGLSRAYSDLEFMERVPKRLE